MTYKEIILAEIERRIKQQEEWFFPDSDGKDVIIETLSSLHSFIESCPEESGIDALWHNTKDELPEENRNVLATTMSPPGRGIMEGGVTITADRGLLEADKKHLLKKWAYLTDLLPKK